MRSKFIFYFCFAGFAFTTLSFAQDVNKAGTSSAQFLKIGIGARAMAMGGAFGALVDDASAMYWNPAGLVGVQRVAFFGSHLEWFADITHDFAGLAVPVGDNNVLGLSATLLNMGEIEITTIQEPRGTGLFYDASDVAVALSYARRLTDRFSVGLTGKFVYESIYNETASTFALDIGTRLETPFKGLKIGMHFSNFGGKLRLDGRDLIRAHDPNPRNTRNSGVESKLATEPWELPVNFRVGIALDIMGEQNAFITSAANRLTFAADGNHPNDGPETGNFGLEYSWRNTIYGRAGYRYNYDLEDLTYGGGLQIPLAKARLRLDYALAAFGELDDVHYFSFGFEF
jgi:hypothetical protein